MWDFIVKGGPVMVPIIAGSIFGLAIILEKLWIFHKIRIDTAAFADEVFKRVRVKQMQEALDLCEQHQSHPLSAVLRAGIVRAGLSVDRLERYMEQAGNNQVQKLEKRLGGLMTITSLEPLMGFLGTITGLIKAFMGWEQAGANVTINALAMGIYEAMITTAAGLMVAIPFALFYNYFLSKLKYLSGELNDYGMRLIEILEQPHKAERV